MRSIEAGILYKQGGAVGLQSELLGDCFTRGEEESSCCRGGAAGLEPTSLVVTSSGTLLLSINKVCMFSYSLVLHRCFVFTCVFDAI